MVGVADFNDVIAVNTNFLHVRVVKIVGEDAKARHVLIDSFNKCLSFKFLSGKDFHAVFEDILAPDAVGQLFLLLRLEIGYIRAGVDRELLFIYHGSHIFRNMG